MFFNSVRIKQSDYELLEHFSSEKKISKSKLLSVIIMKFCSEEKISEEFEKKIKLLKEIAMIEEAEIYRKHYAKKMTYFENAKNFLWLMLSKKDVDFDILKKNVFVSYELCKNLGMKKQEKQFKKVISLMNKRKKGDSGFYSKMRLLLFSNIDKEKPKSLYSSMKLNSRYKGAFEWETKEN